MRAVRAISIFAAIAAVLLGLQVAAPKPAYACTCGISTDWNVRLQHFGAIFAGEVISVEDTINKEFLSSQHITFRVDAAWKGVSKSRITIYSDKEGGGNCGVTFTVGEKWLISTDGDGGSVSSCSLPLLLEHAEEALGALGEPTYGGLAALKAPSNGPVFSLGERLAADVTWRFLQIVFPAGLLIIVLLALLKIM